mmetsp:Transcript_1233/g.4218  ORF Transcript_1233/g.4218 Transcript_1233/m.4218 type:complete len:101 (-) Transcript_1233:241-543(-)
MEYFEMSMFVDEGIFCIAFHETTYYHLSSLLIWKPLTAFHNQPDGTSQFHLYHNKSPSHDMNPHNTRTKVPHLDCDRNCDSLKRHSQDPQLAKNHIFHDC